MTRRFITAGALALATAALLAAAPFWVEKPYSEWSQKEVSKLLSDSPWVRQANITFDMSAMPEGGGMGGRGGRMGGPGGGMGGPGGGMGGGMPQIEALVMWRTALPVRQAMYRAAVLQESPAAEALAKALAEEPAQNIIAVSGLSGPGGPGLRGQGMGGPGMRGEEEGTRPPVSPDGRQPPSEEQRAEMRKQMESRMLAATTLKIGDDLVTPERMETVQTGSGRILLFYFPKTRNVEASDKEAVFSTQMGPMKISAKFKPREMVFAGKAKS